jgi:hypothetical protein
MLLGVTFSTLFWIAVGAYVTGLLTAAAIYFKFIKKAP